MDDNFTEEDKRLVLSIVRRLIYRNNFCGVDENDLFQEGAIALIKAKNSYQKERQVKFKTYATTVIHNHLIDYIRKQKPEKISAEDPTEIGKVDPDPAMVEILNQVLNAHCSALERAIFNDYIKGYTYQEIGKRYEINKKKVDNTIQKILKLARSIYKN